MADREEPKPAAETRSVSTAKKQTANASSQILDFAGIDGEVTEPGPSVGVCEELDPGFKDYFLIRHPWSIYGAQNDTLEKGMKNLKEELPKHGWKITRTGEDDSKNRNMEIVAHQEKGEQRVHITWMKGLDGNEALININVTSACFKVPEGEEIRDEGN